jgi:hypothetical protein
MQAYEIFGGLHVRDTDEIIKKVSSGIIHYLENYQKEKEKEVYQKKERIINDNVFQSMKQVYDLIQNN